MNQLEESEAKLIAWNESIQEEQVSLREQLNGSNEEIVRMTSVVGETQEWNAKLTDDVKVLTKLCQERDEKILSANAVVEQYKDFNIKLTEDTKSLTTRLDERDTEISRLTTLSLEQVASINLHLETIVDRENIISGYEAECKIHIANNEELNKTLADKVSEIKSLREECEVLKTKKNGLEIEL